MAANLFVERVEQLLAGGCASKSGAVIQCATKAAVIEETFRGAIEHDAHAIEQIDDRRGFLAHAFDQRLISQKISTVDGVVEMLGDGIAFTLLIFRGVDSTLRADGVGALYWHDGKQFDRNAGLGDANRRHQSSQPPTNDDDLWLSHFV